MMKKGIFGVTIGIAFFLSACGLHTQAEIPAYRKDSAEMAKKFSKAALESLKSNSTGNVDEAVRTYKDIEHNQAFIEVSDELYQHLDGTEVFAAEITDHILRGGASITQTREIMPKLGAAYGKVLAGIIKGGTVATASKEFITELTEVLHPYYLKPAEYELVIMRTEIQFATLHEILETPAAT